MRLFRSYTIRFLLACIWLIGLTGCVSQSNGNPATPSPQSKGLLITADDIAESNASTAWDVVVRSGARLNLEHSPDHAVSGITIPSRAADPECPTAGACEVVTIRVEVDGVAVNDTQYLRAIPADQIHQIEIFNARSAVEEFGPSASGGAIVVETKASRVPA